MKATIFPFLESRSYQSPAFSFLTLFSRRTTEDHFPSDTHDLGLCTRSLPNLDSNAIPHLKWDKVRIPDGVNITYIHTYSQYIGAVLPLSPLSFSIFFPLTHHIHTHTNTYTPNSKSIFSPSSYIYIKFSGRRYPRPTHSEDRVVFAIFGPSHHWQQRRFHKVFQQHSVSKTLAANLAAVSSSRGS